MDDDDRRPFLVDPHTGRNLHELARHKEPILGAAEAHSIREKNEARRLAKVKKWTAYCALVVTTGAAVTLIYNWGETIFSLVKAGSE